MTGKDLFKGINFIDEELLAQRQVLKALHPVAKHLDIGKTLAGIPVGCYRGIGNLTSHRVTSLSSFRVAVCDIRGESCS